MFRLSTLLLCCIILNSIPGMSEESPVQKFEKKSLYAKATDASFEEILQASIHNSPEKKQYKIDGIPVVFSKIEQLSKIDDHELKKVFEIHFNQGASIDYVIRQLVSSGKFEYVEKIPVYDLFHTPNDLDHRLWNLRKVRAEQAWDITRGNCPIIIAVIDDAIDTLHPDLQPVIWKNTAEIPGNGIDDDGNGYIDDYFGWDAADNNNDPTPPSNVGVGFFDHGTHCAGIAGAQTNNGTGIASLAYDVQIMPIKVGWDTGGGRAGLRNLYQGIEYAVANRAHVVSMSLGGPASSITIQNLIAFGKSRGITFVAAAGNNNNHFMMYPAAYPEVISVAATDSNDLRARFSTYGNWIDISAPGVDIYSTLPYAPFYGYMSGTSMACPLVASNIALMLCRNPNVTPDQLKDCIQNNSDNISALNPSFSGQLGAGRLNAFQSLRCVKTILAGISSNKTRICPGQSVQFLQDAKPFPQTVSWRFPGGIPFTSSSFNPTVTYNSEGTYDVQIIVSDGQDFDTLVLPNYITVKTPSAIISGSRTVFQGSFANIRVDLEGEAPFEVSYSDGTNQFTVGGIYQNPYYIISRIDEKTTFTLTGMKDLNCSGNTSGVAEISIQSNSSCAPGSSFSQVTGSNTNEEGNSVCQIDGYVYVGGFTSQNSHGGEDGLLMKYDTLGNLLWSKVYGGSGNDRIFAMAADSNKNIIMCGTTTSYGANSSSINGLILLVDSSGSVLNRRVYSTSARNDMVCVQPTTDKGYIFSGYNFFSSGNSQGFVLKLDSNLNHQWGKQTLSGNSYSVCYNVVEMPGVGYYATHMHRNGTIRFDCVLAKYDYSGNVQWYKVYGGPFNDAFRGLVVGENNELFIQSVIRISSTNLDLVLLRVDSSGNVLASSRFHTPAFEESPNNGIILDTSGIYFLGKTRTTISSGKWDGKIFKVSFNGEIEWQTGIGTDNFEEIKGVTWVNGNLFYTGYLEDARFGGNDVLFSKIGCTGVNNCLESDVLYTRDTFQLTHLYNANPNIVNVNNVSTISNIGSRNVNLNHEPLCAECTSNQSNTFNQVLADSFDHSPKAFITSNVGNYTLSASMGTVNASNHRDVFVNKISQTGNIEWSVRLNEQNFNGNSKIALTETPSGQIVVCANSASVATLNGRIFIAAISPAGNLLWSKNIAQSSNQDNPASLLSDAAGNIYLASAYNQTASLGSLLITKLDSSGNTIWQRNLNVSGKANAQKMVAYNNSQLYILSQTNIGPGSANPMVTQINAAGTILWNKIINYNGPSSFVDMTLNNDSTLLVLAGSNTQSSFGNSDVLIAAFDTSLSMVWSNYYGAAGFDGAASVSATENGLVVSGNTLSYDGGTPKMFLLDIANNGTKGWFKIYGNPRMPSRTPTLAHPIGVSNQGNIFSLYKDSSLGMDYTGISRMDNCGNSFCHFTQVVPNQRAFNPSSISSQNFSLQSNPAINNASLTAITHNYNDTFLCSFFATLPSENDTCEWIPGFVAEADCYNLPVLLEDRTLLAAGQIFQRRWTLGDGNSILGGQRLQHKYNSAGTYTVHLEIIGINSDNNICKGTDSIEVVVPDELFVQYIDTVTICAGDSALLENIRLSCWELPIRATWTPDEGLSNSSDFEPKASPTIDQKYYVSVIDRNGKKSEDSVFVKIDYSCCKSHASFSLNKEVYCLADSVLFTNTSDAMANANYVWNLGSGSQNRFFFGTNPPKQVFSSPGIYDVSLALEDGCGVDTFMGQVFVLENPTLGFALDTLVCFPNTLQIGGQGVSQNRYLWRPNILPDSTVFNPIVSVDRDTQFTVTMIDYLTQCAVTDTVNITGVLVQQVLPNDTLICEHTSIEITSGLDAPSISWNTGDTTRSILISNPGTYLVTLNFGTCEFSDSMQVGIERFSDIAFTIGHDSSYCSSDPIIISPNKLLNHPVWSNGAFSQNISVNSSGVYWVQDSGQACVFRDSIQLLFENPDSFIFNLGPNRILCLGDSASLSPNKRIANPIWNTGDTTFSIDVFTEGWFSLTQSGAICSYTDSAWVTVEDPESLKFTLGRDTGFCDSEPFEIIPSIPLGNAIWNNGSTAPTLTDTQGGKYWVTHVGLACSFTDSILITRTEVPVFSLGNDTFVCQNQTLELIPSIDVSSLQRIWDNNSTNETRLVNTAGVYSLVLSNGFCSFTDSVEVGLKKMPIIELPEDTVFCKGDTLLLNAFHPNLDAALWQNTDETFEYAVFNPGIYSVTTQHVCGDTTYLVNAIEEFCYCELYVPTAFSPNDDNLNEAFLPSFCELEQYKLEIFNRWGAKVFESSDITKGWNGVFNGKPVPNGSYMWIITLKTPNYPEVYNKTGAVHVIR